MANQDQEIKAFTAVEMAYVKAVIRYSKANLTTADWEKVAEEVNVKDAKCARERFRQISVKHSFGTGAGDSPQKPRAGDSPSKVTKKKGGRARKVKKDESEPESEKAETGTEGVVGSEI